jgi:CheY-like chemotaxis protein
MGIPMAASTIRMLVADDSKAIHQVFKTFVEEAGEPIELVSANDGRECMEFLDKDDVDLAFIDLNMPEMTGLEAIDGARLNGHRTFVTVMSTEDTEPNMELARKLRVYEFLRKPFSNDALRAVLATWRRIAAPMRALIVDDSGVTRRVIQKVLAGSLFNMEVEEAADGEAALEKCRPGVFDVVFLDCNMPGLNGIQTLEKLTAQEPKPRVIMISGTRDEAREHKALALGAAAFLHKPFFPADIDGALHGAFGLAVPRLMTGAPKPAAATPATTAA